MNVRDYVRLHGLKETTYTKEEGLGLVVEVENTINQPATKVAFTGGMLSLWE